jgi:hypothetical protein
MEVEHIHPEWPDALGVNIELTGSENVGGADVAFMIYLAITLVGYNRIFLS